MSEKHSATSKREVMIRLSSGPDGIGLTLIAGGRERFSKHNLDQAGAAEALNYFQREALRYLALSQGGNGGGSIDTFSVGAAGAGGFFRVQVPGRIAGGGGGGSRN